MLLPFSERGKRWELSAQTLRRLACVNGTQQLDPWTLAPKVGLTVLDVSKCSHIFDSEIQSLLHKSQARWSGGVYPAPLPDGTHVCILNPKHSRRRNKITLMEEIVHTYLHHAPTAVRLTEIGLQVRDFNHSQEREAYGIGAAALIPWGSLFSLVNRGESVETLADHYDVTVDLMVYRIKIAGAYRLYSARQRNR